MNNFSLPTSVPLNRENLVSRTQESLQTQMFQEGAVAFSNSPDFTAPIILSHEQKYIPYFLSEQSSFASYCLRSLEDNKVAVMRVEDKNEGHISYGITEPMLPQRLYTVRSLFPGTEKDHFSIEWHSLLMELDALNEKNSDTILTTIYEDRKEANFIFKK